MCINFMVIMHLNWLIMMKMNVRLEEIDKLIKMHNLWEMINFHLRKAIIVAPYQQNIINICFSKNASSSGVLDEVMDLRYNT